MTEPLADSEKDHLLYFIGYGALGADVWFSGMEEARDGKASTLLPPNSANVTIALSKWLDNRCRATPLCSLQSPAVRCCLASFAIELWHGWYSA